MLDASQTVKLTLDSPEDGPVPIHGKGPDWYKHHHDGQESSASNSTKIKEREAHHE